MGNQWGSELSETRAVCVKILSRGQATVSELAHHYGLHRQTVQAWAKDLDIAALRMEYVARLVKKAGG